MCSSAGVTRPSWPEDKKIRYPGAADIPIVRLNPFNILNIKKDGEQFFYSYFVLIHLYENFMICRICASPHLTILSKVDIVYSPAYLFGLFLHTDRKHALLICSQENEFFHHLKFSLQSFLLLYSVPFQPLSTTLYHPNLTEKLLF